MAKSKKKGAEVFGIEALPREEVNILGKTNDSNFFGLTKDSKPVAIEVGDDPKWPRYIPKERKKEVMDAFLTGKLFKL
jgi:hypothetical protein